MLPMIPYGFPTAERMITVRIERDNSGSYPYHWWVECDEVHTKLRGSNGTSWTTRWAVNRAKRRIKKMRKLMGLPAEGSDGH